MNERDVRMASDQGLTASEVAARVARGEVNAVPRSDLREYLDILWRNLFTLFNGLVLPAAIALLLLGKTKDGIGVSGMALTITVLGLIQEIRAKRHLDKLALLTETRARVLRDGQPQVIRASEIVKDDHLLLRAGDPILADGTVLESRYLEVDEALLTGESEPVPRHEGEALLSGSFCVAGEGRYRADRVGGDSFAQRTTREARKYHHVASDLHHAINRTLQILSATAIVLCALYGLLFWVHPFGTEALVEMVAATVTSMIPSGLLLMATLAFVLGAIRMSRQGALVQRLSAVESMAAVNILCLDKTGTLTTGNLQVERIAPLGGHTADEAHTAVRIFATGTADDNKTLQALRAELGSHPVEARDHLPFKSQNRFSAVRVHDGQGERVLVLGAAEAVGPLCADGGWRPLWQELLPFGLRLLLLAEAKERPRATFDGSLDGFQLTPVALIALRDELRPEAAEVLQALAEQDVAFKIISGDNPETVRATVAPLAQGTALPALRALIEQPVTTGAELEQAESPEEIIRDRCVFGRVSPQQKLRIVRHLQGLGYRVGMIGDGVNDVLPIKNATLGIAMGEGSRATRTVSDLVLETNDFRLLPATLDEGRTIVRNLRRACKLFLVKNLYTLILILGILALFGPPAFPFQPWQVTLLNVLTIGLPALLVIANRDPALARTRTGFLGEVLNFVVRTGLVIGVGGLVLVRGVSASGDHLPRMQTLLLAYLILLGMVNILRLLRDGEPPRGTTGRGDRLIQLVAGISVLLFLVVVHWPLMRWLFDLVVPTLAEWGWLLLVAVPTIGVLLLLDWLTQQFQPRA